jgi:hypothetical protein
LAAVVLGSLRAASGIFEDEGAAIAERDFFGLPGGALVEVFGLCAGGVPFLVEPVQIRFVVGDAFLDRLPRGFDEDGYFPVLSDQPTRHPSRIAMPPP